MGLPLRVFRRSKLVENITMLDMMKQRMNVEKMMVMNKHPK